MSKYFSCASQNCGSHLAILINHSFYISVCFILAWTSTRVKILEVEKKCLIDFFDLRLQKILVGTYMLRILNILRSAKVYINYFKCAISRTGTNWQSYQNQAMWGADDVTNVSRCRINLKEPEATAKWRVRVQSSAKNNNKQKLNTITKKLIEENNVRF